MTTQLMKQLLFCLLCVASVSLAAEAPRSKVGVLKFTEVEVTPQFASTVAGAVANELDRTGAFTVTTSEAIGELLALERQRQLMGCGMDESCMTEIVDALGLDFLVSGKVLKSGERSWSLNLTLLDVRRSKREGSESRTATSEGQLLEEARSATRRLVSGLLRARSGTLTVTVSEPGATVKLDDLAVGVSPLAAPLSIPAGVHRLSAEKKGFLALETEVRIAVETPTGAELRLVPNQDYANEYAQHHGRMRLGAWIATGAAGAGVLVGGLAQWRAQALYGAADSPDTFLFYRARLDAGVEREGTVDNRQQATRLGSEIGSTEFVSRVSLIAAGVAGVGAAFFWIAGEDPDRYRPAAGMAWSLSPTPGGLMGSLRLSWD